MKTNIQAKQLSLNCFRANLRPVSWVGLALTLCLFGLLLPAQGQDPLLTNTKHPMDTNVSVGAAINFRVYATSTNLPMTYQWQHEGTNLPNATNVTLVITKITVAHAGGYQATVWNASDDSTNTRTAILTVDPTFTKIMTGAIVTDSEGTCGGNWADYDNDGYVDLSLANVLNTSTARNALYHNNGGTNFSRVAASPFTTDIMDAWGAAWADYDNDGKVDIIFAGIDGGPLAQRLYRNKGNGTFTAVVDSAWRSDSVTATGPWWLDYNNDGYLDLFVTKGTTWGGTANDCLFRNNGDGTFKKITTAEAGPLLNDRYITYLCWSADYDNDGRQELTVQHGIPLGGGVYGSTNLTWRPQDEGGFESVSVGIPGNPIAFWWGDYNNDGWLDAFTYYADGQPKLFRNLGISGGFTNVQGGFKVTTPVPADVAAWGDYDNDGWLDVFFTGAYWYSTNTLNGFYHNNGDGTFTQILTGSPVYDGDRRVTPNWVDYDNDGFLDLFIAVGDGEPRPNRLYHNNGNANHWLKVKLDGRASNRSGIGAKVRVRATVNGQTFWQVREISCGNGYIGQNGLLAHFGLGDATNLDWVRIEWPSGNVQELTGVAPDRLLTLTEPTLITPIRPSASLNGTVTLTRTAVAGATYQWQFNGVDLAGQTNRTLNLRNIVADQQGHYSVVASNATAVTTNFAYVDVDTQFEQFTTGDIVNTPSYSYLPAWGDYDGDGWLDLFVANGGNEGPMQPFLYHNNRDGTFHRTTEAEVGRLAGDKVQSAMGVWGDFDNDGNLDLFIGSQGWGSNQSTNRLYHNLGNGTFAPITSPGGRYSVSPTWGSAWADYDNDGWLDLYPTVNGQPDRLCHNERNGSFSWQRNYVPPSSSSLFLSWGDTDGDGDLDLYVGTESAGCHYYRNDGEGVFTRMTGTNAVTGGGWYGTWADYDNDGSLDLFAQTGLFHNDGHGRFTRVVGGPGVVGISAWVDYDNDGHLDLFSNQAGPSVLYHNNGDGTFTKVTRGSVVNPAVNCNAGAWGDYDNDGCMDLFISTVENQPNYLFRGRPNGNHWLTVKLRGTASNASAIGATVRAYAILAGRGTWQMRQITGMADDLRAHFGVGTTTNFMKLRIEWPSGSVQEFANVAADQILNVWEPPTISAAVRADGACELSITAEPNRGWQIQASADLLTWQTLTTLTSTTATMYFIDSAAAGMDCRFYRLEGK